MTHNDSRFKRAMKKDVPPMPTDMAARFDDTIATFQGHTSKRRTSVWILRFAVFVLVIFLALPNVSPTIAYAMQEIPIIGDIVKVFTVYKLDKRDDKHYQDIEIPQINAAGGNNAAVDYINADVDALTKVVIEEYEAAVEKFPDAHMGLLIDYEVATNTADWFTLRLMVYRDAGSSMVEYYFYHIDKHKALWLRFLICLRRIMIIRRSSAQKSRRRCGSRTRKIPIWFTGLMKITASTMCLRRSPKIRISTLVQMAIWLSFLENTKWHPAIWAARNL